MNRFEEKLNSVMGEPAGEPDSNAFIERLHGAIRHHQTVRRQIISTVSAMLVVVFATLGLFKLLKNRVDIFYPGDETEFLLFADIDTEGTYEVDWLIDDAFVLEALDYLVQESDPVGLSSDLSDELYDFGILNDLEAKQLEG